jgi:hypothetical protein
MAGLHKTSVFDRPTKEQSLAISLQTKGRKWIPTSQKNYFDGIMNCTQRSATGIVCPYLPN